MEERINGFENIGITKKELLVYETLLKHGASTISFLSGKAKLNQRSTYDYIERLIHKGLVGQVKTNNKRLFLGLNPMIYHYIDDEKKEAEEIFTQIEKLGKEEKKEILPNIINSKQEMISAIRIIDENLNENKKEKNYKNKFGKTKEKITPLIFAGENCEKIMKSPKMQLFLKERKPKVDMLSKKFNTNASVIIIISDDIFLIYSVPEEKGFFITDADFTENMRVYFE